MPCLRNCEIGQCLEAPAVQYGVHGQCVAVADEVLGLEYFAIVRSTPPERKDRHGRAWTGMGLGVSVACLGIERGSEMRCGLDKV